MTALDVTHVGDCRRILASLAAEGVKAQCVVTSPPYWGLRDYGIEPVVWGGAADCAHAWGEELTVHKGGPHGDSSTLTNRGANQARTRVADYRAGQFCQLCGAWLGVLGLEPDCRMFIEHIVEVFARVWEVLADDGTVWLNLGDSYVGDAGQHVPTTSPCERVPQGWRDEGQIPRGIRPVGPLKRKDLCLIPHRCAIALQEAGWYVRSDIVWHKPNPMPESATDRPTKAHEYVFLLTKSPRYYYDADAIKEPCSDATRPRRAQWKNPDGWDTGEGAHGTIHRKGREKGKKRKLAEEGSGVKNNGSFDEAMAVMPTHRNKRDVWTIRTEAFPAAHFATFPRELVVPCILAGSRAGDVVLDPFMGSGTTGQVALSLGRRYVGCEANPAYVELGRVHRPGALGLPL